MLVPASGFRGRVQARVFHVLGVTKDAHSLDHMHTYWPGAVSGRARGSAYALVPHLVRSGKQAAGVGSCQAILTSSALMLCRWFS